MDKKLTFDEVELFEDEEITEETINELCDGKGDE